MGLLDFLQSPGISLAAGLLQPTRNSAFGPALQQGIANSLAAQRALLRQQLLRNEIQKAQRAQQARQVLAQGLGTRPTQFRADLFPGEMQANLSGQVTGGLLQRGTGALADNRVTPDELRNLALDQLRLGNVSGVNTMIGYINATTPQTKTELAIAAADGDERAREALQILNGRESRPLSRIAKINADLKNGLITQEEADQQIAAIGRSPGFKEQFMAPILLKIQRGIELTEGEQQVRDFFKTVNPFDEFIRAAMQGNSSNTEQQLLSQAREALAKGKDRAAVEKTLRDRGVDPAKL